ncbi:MULTISPECIES: putative bifunctional diguanylate cyclase/phosphodiesterase [Nocardioides]|uniref:Bifunctional diguanylate cyclase/phosphodiesterase n=1 Tax=Nocardioides vastitatis TaxID=2568655 RepID=A0ABW0Z8N0_9ACTN|nr:EAL domain-containing protein [Nocardioides sp.]
MHKAQSHEHEDRLRVVIEAAPNAMIMANDRGRIVLVNSEAERSFGYTRDELLRMRIEDLVPAGASPDHGLHETYLQHAERLGMESDRALIGVRKDGTELPIEIALKLIVISDEQFVLASIIDITKRVAGRAATDVAHHDALRRSILDTIPIAIIATDREGQIVTANPAAEELLGWCQQDLIGVPLSEIHGQPRDAPTDGSPALSQVPQEVELAYRRKDGSRVDVSEQVVALQDGAGEVTGFLVAAYDIAKRVEARDRVEHMHTHDALTDLPNRAALMEDLVGILEQADRDGTEVALVLLDLDHFKRINDSLGHPIGDELLVHVGERLRSWVRWDDMVARLGGDEFVVVFNDLPPSVDLTPRIEGLLSQMLAPVEVQGYDLAVTASAGGAVYPRDGDNPTTLLRHADMAMYRAKATGRDGVRWFDNTFIEDAQDKLALSGALRQALGQGELSVVYQPQFDLAKGTVEGFEALARWWSPELGSVAPDRFIPVAEDGGMILQLGEWVLRRACADLAVLQEDLGRKLRLAVNVSPRQLRGKEWLAQVTSALEDSGIEPWQLELEITEGILIDDHSDTIDLLTSLRELGVQVAVDDFGCGYSSLAYLAKFPVDKIKIDRSFVSEITNADDDAAIVDAIIVMAHALGMKVLAEGVETEVQQQYLITRGCDEAQGFLYSPGMPVLEAAQAARTLSS